MFTFGIKDFYSTLYKCWSVMIRIDLTLKFIPYMWGGGGTNAKIFRVNQKNILKQCFDNHRVVAAHPYYYLWYPGLFIGHFRHFFEISIVWWQSRAPWSWTISGFFHFLMYFRWSYPSKYSHCLGREINLTRAVVVRFPIFLVFR